MEIIGAVLWINNLTLFFITNKVMVFYRAFLSTGENLVSKNAVHKRS